MKLKKNVFRNFRKKVGGETDRQALSVCFFSLLVRKRNWEGYGVGEWLELVSLIH